MIPLDASQFEKIEERGNVGCGYIPDAHMDSILGCTAKSKRVIAIQVRIFSSKLGIFKGMLFRRPLITKIQLPPSMQKVGPSTVSDLNEEELKSAVKLDSLPMQVVIISNKEGLLKSICASSQTVWKISLID